MTDQSKTQESTVHKKTRSREANYISAMAEAQKLQCKQTSYISLSMLY